ncbi:hypothetical protein CRM22_003015 [Opisthorchis felineus]|uniref:Uncharacterized protein n=1 Tax=Opisthorchis felineus TaxID=147828 RepID=A0A4S2M9G4_OPIFE|nr:hypothetical protein CRM22_003015 [Opisthorchis felineus]
MHTHHTKCIILSKPVKLVHLSSTHTAQIWLVDASPVIAYKRTNRITFFTLEEENTMMFPAILLFAYLLTGTDAITCLTCANCNLPIAAQGSTAVVSEDACEECSLVITFAGSRTPSSIVAGCAAAAADCNPSYVAGQAGAVVTSCCTDANCNALPGAGRKLLPSYSSLFIPFVALFYSAKF